MTSLPPLKRFGYPLERLGVAAAAALVCVLAGAAVVHHGSLPTRFVLGALLASSLVLLIGGHVLGALATWVVASPIAVPWIRYPHTNGLLTFDRLWVPALFAAAIVGGSRRLPVRASRPQALGLAVLVVVWGLRAVTTRPHTLSAVQVWFDAALLPAFLYVVARRVAIRKAAVEPIALAGLVAGVVLATIGIAERLTGFELASYSGGAVRYDHTIFAVRISGPYPVPEVYALVLVVTLALTVYWMLIRQRYLIGWIAICIQSVAVALTLFRAAWLAALLVLAISLSIRPGREVGTVVRLLLVAVVGAALLAAVSSNATFEARLNNADNIDGRIATYIQAVHMARQHPWFGVGVGRFAAVQQYEAPVIYHGVYAVPSPHSSFFATLAEQGIFGIVALLGAIAGVLVTLRRSLTRAAGDADHLFGVCVGSAIVGYLIMSVGLTMLPYGAPNMLLAVLLGVVAADVDRSAQDELVSA